MAQVNDKGTAKDAESSSAESESLFSSSEDE